MIDRIDFNVQQTVQYVSKAVSETQAAVRLQKEARRVRIIKNKALNKKLFFFCFYLIILCLDKKKHTHIHTRYYYLFKNQYAPILFKL